MYLRAFILGNGLKGMSEAEEAYTETITLQTKVLSATHKFTLVTVYSLVWTLEKLGKYEEAKEMAEKSLDHYISVYGLTAC